jgi:hypothetical protein
MCVASFVKVDSGILKLIVGTDAQTVRRSHKPTFPFRNENRLLRVGNMEMGADTIEETSLASHGPRKKKYGDTLSGFRHRGMFRVIITKSGESSTP